MKELLRAYIDPQMLRRMKEDIASELPKKMNISNDYSVQRVQNLDPKKH
jgi:hypothetical protein